MKKIIILLSILMLALAASTTALAIVLAQNSSDKTEETKEEPQMQQVETETTITTKPVETDGQANAANNYISAQEALTAALKALGVERSSVRDIDVELEYKFGQVFYEVDFESGQYDYEYRVDPNNGTILKSFRELDR